MFSHLHVLLLKLLFAPAITLAVSLIIQRWGNVIGGWVAGLPLIAGPISLLLAFDYGLAFAQKAARGTLLGLIGVIGFCVTYNILAQRKEWPMALFGGLVTFAVALLTVGQLSLSDGWTGVLLFLFLCWAPRAIPFADCQPKRLPESFWSLGLRVIVVTFLVAAITRMAPHLGERMSGLLSPLPVFTIAFVVMAHRTRPVRAVARLLRGVLASLWGFAAFFMVIALAPVNASVGWIYSIALALCLLINGVTLQRLTLKTVSETARLT